MPLDIAAGLVGILLLVEKTPTNAFIMIPVEIAEQIVVETNAPVGAIVTTPAEIVEQDAQEINVSVAVGVTTVRECAVVMLTWLVTIHVMYRRERFVGLILER